MRSRFSVYLFGGEENGRAEVEEWFVGFAVALEHERFGASGGKQFRVDAVAELERQK